MKSPYTYGFSPDVSFAPQNRPDRELWRGGCVDCGPSPAVGPMAGVKAVPSGQYMGPIGKVVLSGGGMRGYGYSSGPGIPDAVGMPSSATLRAAATMANLGMASRPQTIALRLSGIGLGDGTADRAACQGISSALSSSRGFIQDINARPRTGAAAGADPGGVQRDRGFVQAGAIADVLGQVGGAFCNMIQTGQGSGATQLGWQPGQGSPMPPGYIPAGYTSRTNPPAPGAALPPWLLPAAGVAVLAVLGIGTLLVLKKK